MRFGNRAGNENSLHQVATDRTAGLKLGHGFHVGCNDADAQHVGKVHETRHEEPLAGVALQGRDEIPVDLQNRRFDIIQHVHARKAGAEIVERKGNATITRGKREAAKAGVSGVIVQLRDVQAHVPGRDPVRRERLRHQVEELFLFRRIRPGADMHEQLGALATGHHGEFRQCLAQAQLFQLDRAAERGGVNRKRFAVLEAQPVVPAQAGTKAVDLTGMNIDHRVEREVERGFRLGEKSPGGPRNARVSSFGFHDTRPQLSRRWQQRREGNTARARADRAPIVRFEGRSVSWGGTGAGEKGGSCAIGGAPQSCPRPRVPSTCFCLQGKHEEIIAQMDKTLNKPCAPNRVGPGRRCGDQLQPPP